MSNSRSLMLSTSTCAIIALWSSLIVLISCSPVNLLEKHLQYSLPQDFQGSVSRSFLETVLDPAVPEQLLHADSQPFIAYDQEFVNLLAENASIDLIASSVDPIADEMGIWVWDHNQVWMASATTNNITYLSILDLSTGKVFQPNTSITVLNPNGGGYHNGKVYIAGDGDQAAPPCIYEIDPVTFGASVYLNSYFGLRLNGPNDLTWATTSNTSYLFFTDDPLSSLYNGGQQPQIPDAVWRFDPTEQTLLPVIDRTDVLVPNGIRVDAMQTKLYVTDTPPLQYGTGDGLTASSAIYVFDLDEEGFPSNRRLFGIAERGIADGLHIDDAGRVWTGEADGIVVRSPRGKVLGMFNSLAILGQSQAGPLQNFALAGDRLIILAFQNIYSVKLSSTIVTKMT